MKALLNRLCAEWEKSLLWVSVVLLTAVALVGLAGLMGEREGEAKRSVPAPPRHSYLNEETAFAFLQPLTLPPKDSRNPFAFSCKFPAQAQSAQPTERKPWRQRTPQPPPPAEAKAPPPVQAAAPAAKPAAPPPPKHVVVVLYRGLYQSRDAAGRQLAFVTAKETPGNATSTQVMAEGQTVAGVTVKRFGPDELVVSGPVSGEVTIPIGKQQKIPLE